jgi:hypothetical protein
MCNIYYMKPGHKKETMSNLLRSALAEAESLAAVERATGVKRQSLMKFLRREQSLRLDLADRLAEHFGIVPKRSHEEIARRAMLICQGDLNTIRVLPYILRLMMAIDAARSAFRWFEALLPDDSKIADTDRLLCTVTMMGWAGETVRLIQEGISKKLINSSVRNRLDRSLQPSWDLIVADPRPEIITKLRRARDKYFAHWDEGIATACIRRLAAEPKPVAFVEWNKTGRFGNTRFPWVYEAIGGDIVDPEAGAEQWKAVLFSISKTVTGLAELASHLALDIMDSHGLKLRESKGSL